MPLFESFENYLPLTAEEKEAFISGLDIDHDKKRRNPNPRKLLLPKHDNASLTESENEINVYSPLKRSHRPLSSAVSSNEALSQGDKQRELTSPRLVADSSRSRTKQRLRSTTSCEHRYDRIYSPLGGSVSNKFTDSCASIGPNSPSKRSILNSNLSLIPDSPNLRSPVKEKSKTLPQNLEITSPIRGSSSSTSIFRTPKIILTPDSPNKSPGRLSGLNFIRRSRSTKLSRSSSLLRSIAAKHIEEGLEDQSAIVTNLTDNYDKFVDDHGGESEVLEALIRKHEEQVANSPLSIRRGYLDVDDDVAVHSGNSLHFLPLGRRFIKCLFY